MPERIRYYFDEHIPKAVATGLRKRGVDIVRAQDAGLRREDTDHWQFAQKERRVIVTWDADFLQKDAEGVAHSGIVHFESGESIGKMINALVL
ncbi:MAG: DUF5615 family PIN-like protein, partial [Chloroflexi bacterium]|nr:DUF5615 family PIN-like protein [Chloroflexota bacterium]